MSSNPSSDTARRSTDNATPVRHAVSVHAFSQAMLEQGGDLARRVGRFGRRHGPIDEDGLAVLAQAYFFCWFHVDYAHNLEALCAAVAERRPTAFRLCCQVGSERWADIAAYATGVRTWLNADGPPPASHGAERIAAIHEWLGAQEPVKEALAELFLAQLEGHLTEGTYVSSLDVAPVPAAGRQDDVASQRAPQNRDAHVDALKARVRAHMADRPEDADDLIDGVLRPSQPPCMHRFSRYQDIKLASIGALKWRRSAPPNDRSRADWEAFWEAAERGLAEWLEDKHPSDAVSQRLQAALGTATDWGRAVVRDFLLQRPEDGGFFGWLRQAARQPATIEGLEDL